jgi:thiamine biosynthesis lipoprotein
MLIRRRNFLAAPALAFRKPEYRFQHDNVLGTSMELAVAGGGAREAETAVLEEIARLCQVVSTYDSASEISRLGASRACSAELGELLGAYGHWERRTGGVISMRPMGGALNVDALGKAFVMEKALIAARRHASAALLNIGGDVAAAGNATWSVGVADPARWHETAAPLTTVAIRDMAIATSGNYERGDHIRDARTGLAANGAASATVIARDTVTANALATALCIVTSHEGLRLVAGVPGAECLIVREDGAQVRSAGFGGYERARLVRTAGATGWPEGYEFTISLTLKTPGAQFTRRPYVAVWVEDAQGKVVRNIAVWASRPRWLSELHTWWGDNRGNDVNSMTRATRPPGRYRLPWEGVDDNDRPIPAGTYTIFVESNRQHGNYAKESGQISCGAAKPARTTLKETSEFEAVEIEYGPRGQTA